jgi:hypothetical protein
MTVAQSSPDLRFLIRDFADVSDPGNPLDIQNVNTAPLPNGSACYVNSKRALYVLDKYSDADADGSVIYAPIAGGGRWVLFGAGVGGAPAVMAYNTEGNTNTFVPDGTWVQPNSAAFAATELNELARWSFTAAGCILTWNGPTLPALAVLTVSLSIGGHAGWPRGTHARGADRGRRDPAHLGDAAPHPRPHERHDHPPEVLRRCGRGVGRNRRPPTRGATALRNAWRITPGIQRTSPYSPSRLCRAALHPPSAPTTPGTAPTSP